jgi:hypothetical protein
MDLKETELEGIYRILLAQDRDCLLDFEGRVINFRFLESFLATWPTTDFKKNYCSSHFIYKSVEFSSCHGTFKKSHTSLPDTQTCLWRLRIPLTVRPSLLNGINRNGHNPVNTNRITVMKRQGKKRERKKRNHVTLHHVSTTWDLTAIFILTEQSK